VHRAWTSPPLDGDVYAEPLVLGSRVFVATENDSVYALRTGTGEVIWRAHLGSAVPQSALPCGNIDPTGITGTPAIDARTGTLYAVAFTLPGRHDLVAIDTSTGRVRFRRSVDPEGADPLVHQQRGALLIANGRVYVPFGGLFGDCGAFHGMVVGWSLDGSGPMLVYQVPSQGRAGIWAPSGASIDPTGNLLVATGNGDSATTFDFGSSVIRLSPRLRMIDWFAPRNWAALNSGDTDLGSIGPAVLPNGLVFQSGKEGVGYLLRLDHLGGIGGESFQGDVCPGGAYGGTAADSPFVYVPCTDGLVALRLTAGPGFEVAWRATGFDAGPPILAGGAVWCVDIGSGRLLAFDHSTGHELFSASIGQVAHFATPTAVDGTIYVAASQRLIAFAGV
jgi:outer membrane protein assembly factor BamB